MRAIVKNLMSLCFFALIHCAGSANASEEDDFVASNIISVFYHELGHAVIDMMGVPIFGQEEDAADVFSILLLIKCLNPKAQIPLPMMRRLDVTPRQVITNPRFGMFTDQTNNAITIWFAFFMEPIQIFGTIWPQIWAYLKSALSVAKKNINLPLIVGVQC